MIPKRHLLVSLRGSKSSGAALDQVQVLTYWFLMLCSSQRVRTPCRNSWFCESPTFYGAFRASALQAEPLPLIFLYADAS